MKIDVGNHYQKITDSLCIHSRRASIIEKVAL